MTMLARRFLFKFNFYSSIRRFGVSSSGFISEDVLLEPKNLPPRKPAYKKNRDFDIRKKDRQYERLGDNFVTEIDKPPLSRHVDEVLTSLEESDRFYSFDECERIRQKLFNLKSADFYGADDMEKISIPLDGTMLQSLLAIDRYQLGLSYSKFILDKKFFNPGCVAPSMRLIRNFFMKNDEKVLESQKLIDELATEIHEKVLNEFSPALRKSLLIDTMSAVACSSNWRKALEWVETNRISFKFRELSLIGNPLVIKLLEDGQSKLAFDFLKRLLADSQAADIHLGIHNAFWNYVESILDKGEGYEKVSAAMDGFAKAAESAGLFGSWLPMTLQGKVENIFSRLKNPSFDIQHSKVSTSGQCSVCNHLLEKFVLSNAEFKGMSRNVIKRFVTGRNVYQWTTPDELSNFERILSEQGPFDVIVDGLNVVHSNDDLGGLGIAKFEKLITVLHALRGNPDINRILVLLRPYARIERFRGLGDRIYRLATFFTCGHQTVDDSYLMYAALCSGPRCYFLSNDLLRSQNQQVSMSLMSIFQKWRRLRQIHFETAADGSVNILWPSTYAIRPQRNGNNYHFPIQNDSEIAGTKFNVKIHEEMMNWLCIRGKI